MPSIRLARPRRRALIKWAGKQADTGLLVRALVVAAVAAGRRVADVSIEFACARSFVYRAVHRYSSEG